MPRVTQQAKGKVELIMILSKTFSDINHTNIFLALCPKAIEIKTKTNKWDLIKFTSFCTAKTKRQPADWEKVFANDATNNDLKKNKKQGLNL